MASGFIRFEDKEDGSIDIVGGIEGDLNLGSGAHATVLRLHAKMGEFAAFLGSLPPVKVAPPIIDGNESGALDLAPAEAQVAA